MDGKELLRAGKLALGMNILGVVAIVIYGFLAPAPAETFAAQTEEAASQADTRCTYNSMHEMVDGVMRVTKKWRTGNCPEDGFTATHLNPCSADTVYSENRITLNLTGACEKQQVDVVYRDQAIATFHLKRYSGPAAARP